MFWLHTSLSWMFEGKVGRPKTSLDTFLWRCNASNFQSSYVSFVNIVWFQRLFLVSSHFTNNCKHIIQCGLCQSLLRTVSFDTVKVVSQSFLPDLTGKHNVRLIHMWESCKCMVISKDWRCATYLNNYLTATISDTNLRLSCPLLSTNHHIFCDFLVVFVEYMCIDEHIYTSHMQHEQRGCTKDAPLYNWSG